MYSILEQITFHCIITKSTQHTQNGQYTSLNFIHLNKN